MNYNIYCYVNKKKQIALTKENEISFLKNFNLPLMKKKENNTVKEDWRFLKNYKNSISNLNLNINLYYKFSNKIPKSYSWYSLNSNNEFMPCFTLKIFNQVSLCSNEKKIAIIGAGIAGLTLANLIKNIQIMNLWFTKEKKVYLLKGLRHSISK